MADGFSVGRGFVELDLNASAFGRGVSAVEARMDKMAARAKRTGDVARNMLLIGAGAMTGLTALAMKQIEAEDRLASAVERTGQAAGFTAEELKKQASAMQEATGYADDQVLAMQAVLLSFKSITGDEFVGAQEAVANLAFTLDQDLKSTAIQVGKALEDPVKGISAMTRSGVSFTEAEKEMIKQLVEGGNKAEAQRVILQALAGQTAEASSRMKGAAGDAIRFKNDLGDLGEELGRELLPIVSDLLKEFRAMMPTLRDVLAAVRPFLPLIVKVSAAVLAFTFVGARATQVVLGLSKAVLFLAANPLVAAAVAVLALGAAFVVLGTEGDTLMEKMANVWMGIVSMIEIGVGSIGALMIELVRIMARPLLMLAQVSDFLTGTTWAADINAMLDEAQDKFLGMGEAQNYGKADKQTPGAAGTGKRKPSTASGTQTGGGELPEMQSTKAASGFIGLTEAFRMLSTTDPNREILKENKTQTEVLREIDAGIEAMNQQLAAGVPAVMG